MGLIKSCRHDDQGDHTSEEQEHFYQAAPIFPSEASLGFPAIFLAKPNFTGRFFSSREEAHWQGQGWRDGFEGILRAVCAGKSLSACSCGCSSPPLLTFLIFQTFYPFFNIFFCAS